MKTDLDFTMAIDDSFNAILKEIQMSNLNFLVNMTPYAAYITIKKTTIIDKNGYQALPAPPAARLLEKSRREKQDAVEEIARLQEALLSSEDQCKILA